MKTLDQIRAKFAWGRVQGVSPDDRPAYRNLAKSLPALVMSNGLMQTLAFLKSKADKSSAHGRLLQDILAWLGSQEATVLQPKQVNDFPLAMSALVTGDSIHYQKATEEALAVLRWIRYLADTVV